MTIERCCICDEPTEKAGANDDSIYIDTFGPLCEGCYDTLKPLDAVIMQLNKEVFLLTNDYQRAFRSLQNIAMSAGDTLNTLSTPGSIKERSQDD